MRPCDIGYCVPENCQEEDYLSNPNMEVHMDTNTITLTLMGTKLMATLNLNGSIFGQVYRTRKEALEMYFKEAEALAERGVLAEDSSILD